jgi:tRNA1(Val) A37 N6-methylase TrmN6
MKNNPALKTVTLPDTQYHASGSIVQNSRALGASSATAALYSYVLDNISSPQLRILEAGSGSGILSIMLQLARPDWDITGLEVQAPLHDLAQANAEALGILVRFFCADLRHYTDTNKYDLIVSNPPWQKVGQGWVSPNPERAICRTELCCTMPALLAFCKRNLGSNKQAVLLYPPSRLEELISEAETAELSLINSIPVDKSTMIFHLLKG